MERDADANGRQSPQGHDFEVKGHFKLLGSKSTVEFKNASDSSPIELSVKGDWIDRSAKITIGDRPVAEIARKFMNVREIFGGKQTVRGLFETTQYPGPC